MLIDIHKTVKDLMERERALATLEKLKKIEAKTSLHAEKIGNKTTVACKRKENIELYKKQFFLQK